MSKLRPHEPWTPYAFLLPALLILGVFVIFAFVQVAYLSLTRVDLFGDGSLMSRAEWVGLENYRRVLGGERFWWTLGNSMIYLVVTPAIMVVSLAAAMTVHSGLRGTGPWLRALLFLPVVTPTIVAAVAWRVLFREEDGLINGWLGSIGLGPVPWLTGWPWVLLTAMVVTLWKGFGYYMMIFLAGLMSVPRELEEAAGIDGAGRWGVFRHVTLPSLRPVLVLVLIISSIGALKVFDELWVVARGAPTESKTVVPLIYDTAFDGGSFGAACAIGVCLFVVLLAFSVVNLRLGKEED
ncbi:MAG: sugar ABC transporter permease [Planctomycetota bacterium]